MDVRLTTILVLAACASGTLACGDILNCTDQGCEPTYSLHVECSEPALETGLWRLDLEIDGAMVTAECMVTGPNDGPESIPCDLGPWSTEPERPIEVSVSVNERIGPGSGEPTDSGEPPEMSNQGIFVTVYSRTEDAPVSELSVSVLLDDAFVFEMQSSPTYEVEEDFNGPGCGSCLRGLDEVTMLP